MISIDVKENLTALNAALKRYIALTGKSVTDVMRQKGLCVIMGNSNAKYGPTYAGLYQRIRAHAPAEGAITSDAMRRFKAAGRGAQPLKLRERAMQRARNLMEGRKSGVFNIIKDINRGNRIEIRQARFSVRKGRGRIIHTRKGYGAVREGRQSDVLFPGDAVLNLRAVANIIELGIREAGRGYLALSFLARKWKKAFGSSSVTRGSVSITNLKGSELGAGVLRGGGTCAEFAIKGFISGQEKTRIQRDVAQVLADVTADTLLYVERKEAERLEQEIKKVEQA